VDLFKINIVYNNVSDEQEEPEKKADKRKNAKAALEESNQPSIGC